MPGGYRVRMIRRPFRALLAAAAVVAVTALAGCTTPTPDPTPTPTGFATEAEAYAAAEATYRAYVDALNRVDLSDPATFEDVYAWTTGEANAAERKTLSQMHADGWVVSGETIVVSASGEAWNASTQAGTVFVCVGVESVQLVDAKGESMVAPNRPAVQTVNAGFIADSSTPTGVALVTLEGSSETDRCSG